MNEKRQKLNEAYDTHKKENYKSSSSSKVSKIFSSASLSSIQKKNSSGKNWGFIFANRQFLEYFANTNFREFVLFKYFAKTNFREFVTFKYFAKTYFREFRQNSRNSRKLILLRYVLLKKNLVRQLFCYNLLAKKFKFNRFPFFT